MPRSNSPSFQNCFCSNAPQPRAAAYAIVIPACSPWLAVVIELYVIKKYWLRMLRLIYICPALSMIAGVIVVVAYCKRITPGFIIALALNGMSSLGWIVAWSWLIISWSASSGYFAMLDSSGFIWLFSQFFTHMVLTLALEGMLYCAYVDSKHEAHASNSINQSPVPETSMNPGSAEIGHSNEA